MGPRGAPTRRWGSSPLLSVEDVSVTYQRHGTRVPAVRAATLSIAPGEAVGLVGESGCGKSTLAMAVMRLIPSDEGRVESGRILFEGQDLLAMAEDGIRRIRGARIGMVFQDPFSALNPVFRIADQVWEAVAASHPTGHGNRDEKVRELLSAVRLPEPDRVANSYPHQLSGGMRQRVCLAMALAGDPALLIADEPTTALDASVQKEILDLLKLLRQERGLSLLLITHNFSLVSYLTERVYVMYSGEVVEQGRTSDVLQSPKHPYTRALLATLPERANRGVPLSAIPGALPDPWDLPSGCIFHPRCAERRDDCSRRIPPVVEVAGGRRIRCVLYE